VRTLPRHSVPVTTVPKPSARTPRSTGKRAGASSCRPGSACQLAVEQSEQVVLAARPSTAENSTSGAPASGVAESSARTSRFTISIQSRSTRSALVSTTMARGTPRS
jgi:hypothetical protein